MKFALSSSTLRRMRVFAAMLIALAIMFAVIDAVAAAEECGENTPALESKPIKSGHAPVNGIEMYYEVHGSGDGIPLVLLHGGGSTIEVTFSKVLPLFEDTARMRHFEDVPDELVRSLRAPTPIVLGDRDIVKPEHALELSRLIPNARLLIMPAGHGDYIGEAVMTQSESRYPELAAWLIREFLESRSGAIQ